MKNIFITIYLSLIFITSINAQFSTLEKNYNLSNGLPSPSLSYVYCSSNNIVWAGGYSLYSFDGANFETYGTKSNLPVSQITCINEDQKKNIWVANYYGLYKLNKNTKIFEEYIIHSTQKLSITNIEFDSMNTMYVSTSTGLFIINDFEKNNKKVIKVLDKIKIYKTSVFAENVFIGSETGLYKYTKGNIKKLNISMPPKSVPYITFVKALNRDECIFGNGYIMLWKKGQTIRYKDIILRSSLRFYQNKNNIEIFGRDTLYLTYKGIKIKNITSLNSQIISTMGIDIDKNGNIWIAHFNGLERIEIVPFKIIQNENTVNINAIGVINDKTYITNARNIVSSIENDNVNENATFKNILTRNKINISSGITNIIELSKHNFIISSVTDGIFKVDTRLQKVGTVKIPRPIATNLSEKFYKTDSSIFFTNTEYLIEQTASGRTDLTKLPNLVLHDFPASGICKIGNSIAIAKPDKVFIITNGITKVAIVDSQLIDIPIYRLVNIGDSILYTSADGVGLVEYRYDSDADNYVGKVKMSLKDGFPESLVCDMISDKNGNVWILTLDGIYLLKHNPGGNIELIEFPYNYFINKETWDNGKIHLHNDDIYITLRNSIFKANIRTLYSSLSSKYNLSIDLISIKIDSLHHDLSDNNNVSFTTVKNNLVFEFTNPTFYTKNHKLYYAIVVDKDTAVYETKDDIIYLKNINAGKYTLLVTNHLESGWQKEISFTIKKKWYLTTVAIVIYVFLFILLVFIISFYYIKYQRNLDRKKNEMIINELKSLKAQINPHFIQNIFQILSNRMMNGLKSDNVIAILQNTSNYFRAILYNAEKELITLEDEIEFLKKYLNFQMALHENKFNYSIQIQNEIDTYDIIIPTLILQPFVENCIKHGFRNSNIQNGIIKISFDINTADDLVIKIEDNGVGVKNSYPNSVNNQDSKGLGITISRLNLYYRDKYKLVTNANYLPGQSGYLVTLTINDIYTQMKKSN